MAANNGWRGIPEPRLQVSDRPLRFSFKHLHLEHGRFHINNCNNQFLLDFIYSIREFSTWTVDAFTDQYNNFHRHSFGFEGTTEPNGFLAAPNIDPDQLGLHEAWQFAVPCESAEVLGRVHGILIDDTFFVVWLDPNHQLFT